MDYFVVFRRGEPDTWHITSADGFYDVALTPHQALKMISENAEQTIPDELVEFRVRWINTPDDFTSPNPDDLPEQWSPEMAN